MSCLEKGDRKIDYKKSPPTVHEKKNNQSKKEKKCAHLVNYPKLDYPRVIPYSVSLSFGFLIKNSIFCSYLHISKLSLYEKSSCLH